MAVFRSGGGAAGVGGGSGGDAAGPRMLSGGRAATGSGGGLEIKEQGPISFTSAGDRIVTLHNSSDAAAVINRIEFRGPASTDFTAHGPALPLTLASRARARYLVRFDPSAPGQRRAILSFGGGAGDLAAVGLVGEGQSVAASAGSQTPAVPLAAVEEAETKVRTEGTSSQVRDLSAGQSAAVAGAAGSNLDHVLDRAYEKWNVEQLVDAPVDALQGVSKRDAEALERAFGIRTIGDMGANRFFLWARSVVALFESGEGGKIEKGR